MSMRSHHDIHRERKQTHDEALCQVDTRVDFFAPLVLIPRHLQVLQLEPALVPHEVAESLRLERPREDEAHDEPLFQLVEHCGQLAIHGVRRKVFNEGWKRTCVNDIDHDQRVARLTEHDN